MEVAAAVTSHDFQLAINGLDDIGGGKRTANVFRIVEKGQVVQAFFAKFGDESGAFFGKAISELFELLIGYFQIPGRLNGAPALLKLSGIGFAEMSFGIALHVHGTELNVGVGEQALGNGEQAGKVILPQESNAAQPAFEQTAQHELPVFEIFATWAWEAGEDLPFAIATQGDDHRDTSRRQRICVGHVERPASG